MRIRLAEAEQALLAIRQGDVDALVVKGATGPQIYTLLNANRPYRNIVERMQEGALTLTVDGTILYANQRFGSFLTLSPATLVGQKLALFITADHRSLFDQLLQQGGRGDSKGELALRAADGAAVPIFLSMVDLPEDGGGVISAIVTDLRWQKQQVGELAAANLSLLAAMEERERAEEKLRQAQKIQAVGQLTAGIAHDFNNLLLVIAGNLELLQRRLSDSWLQEKVAAGLRAVERGTRLTQQLLAFGRRQSLRPEAVSVNALLLDMDSLLRIFVGDPIRLSFVLDPDLPLCLVDSTELQGAILNLAANAKDAMPEGGALTITTARVRFDAVPMDGLEPRPIANIYRSRSAIPAMACRRKSANGPSIPFLPPRKWARAPVLA